MAKHEIDRKPKVEIKPVAWSGGVAYKYQAFVTVTRSDGSEKVMTGDPRSTKGGALRHLQIELSERHLDIAVAISAASEFVVVDD